MYSENRTEQTQVNQLSKELALLREIIALEITSLDIDEKKESLLNCSSKELVSKLMQNIMKKEGEITLNLHKQYRTELEKKQESVEEIHKKLKYHESWITELENENEKMSKELTANKEKEKKYEYKLKTISHDLTSSHTEVLALKGRVVELTNLNGKLLADIDGFKEQIKNQNDTFCSFQNKIRELSEQIIAKTKLISELEFKLSSNAMLYNINCVNNNEDALLKESSIKDDLENFKYEPLFEHSISKFNILPNPDTNISANVINTESMCSKLPGLIEKNTKPNHSFIDALEQEKALIKSCFVNGNNLLSDKLLTCCEEILILKDIIQIIADKIVDMENIHKTSIKQFQNTIGSTIKELNYYRVNIFKLCKEFHLDYQNLEMNCDNLVNETTYDSDNIVASLKDELELAKDECTHIMNYSNKFQQIAKMGHHMMKHLREEFEVLKYKNTQHCRLIKDLSSAIKEEKQLNAVQKDELEENSKHLESLIKKNNLLESQVKHLESELSDFKHILSKFEVNLPKRIEDTSKFSLLNIIYTEHVKNKALIDSLTDDSKFFNNQFNLLYYYVESTEKKLIITQEQKEKLQTELKVLKDELANTKTLLEEANIFFKRLSLSVKTSTKQEAAKVIEHVLSEYNRLKESEVNLLQECDAKEQKLTQQLEELKLIKNENSSLKQELANCEDCIRTLRSELRTVRVQCQRATNKQQDIKKEIFGNDDNVLINKKTTDTGVQAGNLCCKNLEQEILQQKDLLKTYCSRTSELELLIQRESYPYKNKVSELELSLLQAKERIKALNLEVTRQKNYNKDLIEFYNSTNKST